MGISLSTTTTTTTSRRRAPYPPMHPHTLDYYPSYPPMPPYPSNPVSSSPPLYYPYYNSNAAYTLCNHANPTVGQPYYGSSFDFHQSPAQPQPQPQPRAANQKQAKVVNSDVNVHKDSLRLEIDELNPDHYLVSFVFDALVDGSIRIYYFAKEEANQRVLPLFPETYVPIKVPFRKGLHQEFRQPSGTGVDLRFFPTNDITNLPSRDDVFPIIISADTCPNPYILDDRTYLSSHTFQQQITQVIIGKNREAQFTAKVIRQLLWSGDVCYELREIYGLEKSGKECVVCMTEPKAIALLPCRHMCMCSSCAKALRLQSNKCPICRESIEALLEIKIDNMDFSHNSL